MYFSQRMEQHKHLAIQISDNYAYKEQKRVAKSWNMGICGIYLSNRCQCVSVNDSQWFI